MTVKDNLKIGFPLLQLRHAIQGNLDAEHTRKHAPVVEESDDELNDFEDPQHLEVIHPYNPDGYKLVSDSKHNIDSGDELENSTSV